LRQHLRRASRQNLSIERMIRANTEIHSARKFDMSGIKAAAATSRFLYGSIVLTCFPLARAFSQRVHILSYIFSLYIRFRIFQKFAVTEILKAIAVLKKLFPDIFFSYINS
jgi:hypothetical protein